MPFSKERSRRPSFPSPPILPNQSAAVAESGGAAVRYLRRDEQYSYACARRVFDVIEASSRRDIAALTGLCDADMREAIGMLLQSGAIRKKVGVDVSGRQVDYFELTGVPLPEADHLVPVSRRRPTHDFDALSAAWAGAR
ncbi:hypothetical protein D3C81_1686810 [compost metagenome]